MSAAKGVEHVYSLSTLSLPLVVSASGGRSVHVNSHGRVDRCLLVSIRLERPARTFTREEQDHYPYRFVLDDSVDAMYAWDDEQR